MARKNQRGGRRQQRRPVRGRGRRNASAGAPASPRPRGLLLTVFPALKRSVTAACRSLIFLPPAWPGSPAGAPTNTWIASAALRPLAA